MLTATRFDLAFILNYTQGSRTDAKDNDDAITSVVGTESNT